MLKYLVAAGLGGYFYDKYYGYSRITRNLRTIGVALETFYDYKIKFARHPEKLQDIHLGVAKRVYSLLGENGGLYIKLGQGIATMNHVLPKSYREVFVGLQDKAPHVNYEEVCKVFDQEFGKRPEEIFATFDHEPVASASIAQVHKATLHDGRTVAVKIQKPSIKAQAKWDLECYGVLLWIFEKSFDLPIYFMHKYVKEQILKETDFVNEARNMEKFKHDFNEVKNVTCPYVVWDLTSERILVQEWIEGVKITDEEAMKKKGYNAEQIMNTVVDTFAKQIFETGFVHCDPHPGNLIIREKPDDPKKKQSKFELVVIDHGLCVQEREDFRQQYCDLWISMLSGDTEKLKEICRSWGVEDAELFASMQMMRPFDMKKARKVPLTVNTNERSRNEDDPHARSAHSTAITPPRNRTREEVLATTEKIKARFRKVLGNTNLLPKELIFVGRNMNIVRANNKDMGSLVNRINIMCNAAIRGSSPSWIKRVHIQFQFFLFHLFFKVQSFFDKFTGQASPDINLYLQQSAEDMMGLAVDEDLP